MTTADKRIDAVTVLIGKQGWAREIVAAADAADDHVRVPYRLVRWAIDTMELQSGGKPVPAADALREVIDIDEAVKAERARHGDDEL